MSDADLETRSTVSAAVNSVKMAIEQQAAEYANLALDKEFATKRPERQKQFEAETETEERDRILAYLKPKLTKETYESVLSELGLDNSTSLVAEKATHIDLTSESSSDKDACDVPSANKGEGQSSTTKVSSSEDILNEETVAKEALKEVSGANRRTCNQSAFVFFFIPCRLR